MVTYQEKTQNSIGKFVEIFDNLLSFVVTFQK